MCSNQVLIFSALVFLGPLWTCTLTQACRDDELPRDQVLAWFKGRVLEGLGLEEPPASRAQGPERGEAGAGRGHRRSSRARRAAWVDDHLHHHHHKLHPENSQIILFPSSDSPCTRSGSSAENTATSHFTYYFQPSMNNQELTVTSAHFWFYAGAGSINSSAPLFILTSEQQLLQAAEAPSTASSDGWITYRLEWDFRAAASQGPFVFQVRCPTCECRADEPDKTPFLHLSAQPRDPERSPRAAAATTIPWSSNAAELLQRPLWEREDYGDCRREEMEVSFEELGWEHWIVHPKALTFHYCHGNCSAVNRTASPGIRRCCAPVPGTMRSLRVTTTSDGGYSFQYETLPNITPEECTCI